MTSNAQRASALVSVLRAAVEGDLQTVSAICTEDVRVWSPALTAASRQELVESLGERDEALAYADVEIVPLDVSGPYACAEWSVTLSRPSPTDAATGSPRADLTLHGAGVAEFRDEAICALRLYWDEAAVLDRLGEAAPTGH